MSQNLLDDYLDLEPFAVQVKRDPRTVRRWLNERDGLPYTRLGSRILIYIPAARDWLQRRMCNPNPMKKQAAGARDFLRGG